MNTLQKKKRNLLEDIILPPLFSPLLSSPLFEKRVLSCFTLFWPAVLNEYINTDE